MYLCVHFPNLKVIPGSTQSNLMLKENFSACLDMLQQLLTVIGYTSHSQVWAETSKFAYRQRQFVCMIYVSKIQCVQYLMLRQIPCSSVDRAVVS